MYELRLQKETNTNTTPPPPPPQKNVKYTHNKTRSLCTIKCYVPVSDFNVVTSLYDTVSETDICISTSLYE